MESTPTNQEIISTTLASYSKHIEEYKNKKDKLDTKRTNAYWPGVEYFLDQLEPNSTIFEVGSGSGYDAIRIESQGFIVERSDIVDVFINNLKTAGYRVIKFSVLDTSLQKKQTAIYANAVLLHFNLELFRKALHNIYKSLKPNGLLCIGMKLGDFEGWRNKGLSGPRYFKFWHAPALHKELKEAGFDILNSFETKDKGFEVITAKKVD